MVTKKIKDIISFYNAENIATKTNLARILIHGKLAGTGRMVILPVDQGFEHGPARSFSKNPVAYDPLYHHQLAVDAGLNAYAAPLGMLEASANEFVGAIPLILKINSSNSLHTVGKDQAVTASVQDAVRLGCVAIGFTIYPGSESNLELIEEFKELAREAKSYGLAVVLWSYPRGKGLSKEAETSLDVCAYAAHMAVLLGANVIKVKLPTAVVGLPACQEAYQDYDMSSLDKRVSHIKQACFNGKRLVVFSGGSTKTEQDLYDEVKAIHNGNGNGSIIGRNVFQRPREQALAMLNNIINIYLGKDNQ